MSKFSVEDFLIEVNAKGKDMTDDEYDEYFSKKLDELSEEDYNEVIGFLADGGTEECDCEDSKESRMDELEADIVEANYALELQRLEKLNAPYETEDDWIYDGNLTLDGIEVAETFAQMVKIMVKNGVQEEMAYTVANNYLLNKDNREIAKIQSIQAQQSQV